MSANKEHVEKLEQAIEGLQHEVQWLGVGLKDCLQRFGESLKALSDVIPPKANPSLSKYYAESSRQNVLDVGTKIEFPRFAGGDPTEWLSRVEQFFDLRRAPEDHKVSLASFHMEGEANEWWQFLERIYKEENQTVTWERFVEELWARFGVTYGDQELLHIKQSGSLRDYLRDFEKLGNRVQGGTQRALVETFMRGLKAEIADGIKMHDPKSLKDAISLARRQDERLQQQPHPPKKMKQAVGGVQDKIQELGVCTSDHFQQSFSHPPTHSDDAGSSRQNILDVQIKIEFPWFEGGDPTEWFSRAEQFFGLQRTPEDQKVIIASLHMKGEAKQWWKWLNRESEEENQTVSWEKFVEELQAWFCVRDDEDVDLDVVNIKQSDLAVLNIKQSDLDCFDIKQSDSGVLTIKKSDLGRLNIKQSDLALLNIKQSGSLRDYVRDFERLGNRTQDWTQGSLVETFMKGLKDQISGGIRMFKPKYLNEAVSFARMRDQQLQRQTTPPSSDSQRGVHDKVHSTKMTYAFEPTDLVIYKAALDNHWDSVSAIFDHYPELMTKTISRRLETPLMIAVGTNRSHEFVKKLCERLSREAVYAKNIEGNNALHYAAMVGNLRATRLLVQEMKHYDLMSVRNNKGNIPLALAWAVSAAGWMPILMDFLVGITSLQWSCMLADNTCHCRLASLTIHAGKPGYAVVLIDGCPNILPEECCDSLQRTLEVLATKVDLFPNGCKLGFWRRLIYSLMPPINLGDVFRYCEKFMRKHGIMEVERPSNIMNKINICFWKFLSDHVPAVLSIYEIQKNHAINSLLVEHLCETITGRIDHDMAWEILGSTIAIAVIHGNYNLIEACILAYPSIMWYNFKGSNLFHLAIKQRQEKVYNIIYQMSNHKAFMTSQVDDTQQENVLHITAKLAPSHRLNTITGAALQMQRELQWFKEIETLVPPSCKEALNKDSKTPKMVFTDQHKDLLKEGQQWMKDTSASCTVVAALIITVAFAAVFTVPGGNKDDDGKPMFLNNRVFMLFTASDAIALFSSITSVLMFLGILTSRYAEEDFLYSLPRKMTIGLVSLFLSLAATLVAFSATLALVLQDKVTWMAAPLVVMTSIPVCLFGFLQFPLLVELVKSTFGRSIFGKQSERMIH